jgi:RNA polymerase sigma-70 factor (ECF subfamily)
LIPSTIGAPQGRKGKPDMTGPGSPIEPTVAGPARPADRHPRPADRDEPLTESADAPGLRVAFLAHGGELYGYARRSLGDARAAEDVVQETFIRAWRARDRFDTSLGTLRTWLFTIARRVVIDHARARSIRQTEPLPVDLAHHDDDVENAMVGWQVEEALARLRPEHRQVVVETYYRGRSGREVAEELGIPEGTVRSRLFYGLRTLRLALEEMGWDR